MKGWLQKSTLTLSLLAFCSCDAPTPQYQGFLPTNSFDAVVEELPIWKACENMETHGCASIRTVGNPVRGSYYFKDIYTKCDIAENNFVISISNSVIEIPTFALTLNLPDASLGTHKCDDGSTENCKVALSLHTTHTYSSSGKPCIVSITSESPIAGEISCDELPTVKGSIAVATGSVFECQNSKQ